MIDHASDSGTALAIVKPSKPLAPVVSIMPAQARSDDHLIELWLRPRSPRTCRAYQADITAFRARITSPLRDLTLSDLYGFQDSLAGLAPATRARKISSVKSLLSKGHKLGYLPINLGAGWELPKIENVLGERILAEHQVRDFVGRCSEPARSGAAAHLLLWRPTDQRGVRLARPPPPAKR